MSSGRASAWAAAAVLVMTACAEADPAALILRLTSDLAIGPETNSVAVRVRADDVDIAEASYPLGDGERATWPQTLPIVAGDRHPKSVAVAVELRWTTPGSPSAVVGYGEASAPFPGAGRTFIDLDVPRSCVDADGDGFGVGFGCDKPDCDDEDELVPAVLFCPGFDPPPEPDGGVAEHDAGVTPGGDAGPPPRDSGVLPRDAGVRPDSGGGERCGQQICDANEVCLGGQCLRRCQTNEDCEDIHLGCLERLGVCICRVPCRTQTDCGSFMCTDGCCQL